MNNQTQTRGLPSGRASDATAASRRVALRQKTRVSSAEVASAPSKSSKTTSAPPKPSFSNANFPVDPEGRTYHLGTKKGEVANRILSVGSTQRAQLLSQLLEAPTKGKPLFTRLSSRGFLTITGRYNGMPVSIVSTHMGMPNMDFVVRENRAVVDGQLAIIRLGTCGAVQPPAKLGDLLVASEGSIAVRREPDAWTRANGSTQPYAASLPVAPDPALSSLLYEEAVKQVGAGKVVTGLNASADSFYSSQGRLGGDFDDQNEGLISALCKAHPSLVSLEMETFHLLDLARCARGGSVRGVGMCIALAERYSNRFLDYPSLEAAELSGGRAALAALARAQLQDDASLTGSGRPGVSYVWV